MKKLLILTALFAFQLEANADCIRKAGYSCDIFAESKTDVFEMDSGTAVPEKIDTVYSQRQEHKKFVKDNVSNGHQGLIAISEAVIDRYSVSTGIATRKIQRCESKRLSAQLFAIQCETCELNSQGNEQCSSELAPRLVHVQCDVANLSCAVKSAGWAMDIQKANDFWAYFTGRVQKGSKLGLFEGRLLSIPKGPNGTVPGNQPPSNEPPSNEPPANEPPSNEPPANDPSMSLD